MGVNFDQPGLLVLALLALWPLRRGTLKATPYPWLALWPVDPWSQALDWGLRGLTALALLAVVIGMAGPYREEQWLERQGNGAHIVLLLDRSSSMNENFTGSYLGGTAEGAKGAVARRLLADFIQQRPHDLFAMVAFSAAPVYVLPLSDDRAAVLAAIRGSGRRGYGNTNVGSGLAMALNHFENQPVSGARVILLVSDGAARMEETVGAELLQRFKDSGARLYWLYLRGRLAPDLYHPPAAANETTSPEYFLHRYFQSLGTAYHPYQVDNPGALRAAMDDIARLESQPLRYYEKQSRRDLSAPFYGVAAVALALLALLKRWELS